MGTRLCSSHPVAMYVPHFHSCIPPFPAVHIPHVPHPFSHVHSLKCHTSIPSCPFFQMPHLHSFMCPTSIPSCPFSHVPHLHSLMCHTSILSCSTPPFPTFPYTVHITGSSPSVPLQNPHLSEGGLDPKYLALQPPASTGNVVPSSITPGVVRPQSRGEATTAGGGQVPLLSAYFPKS